MRIQNLIIPCAILALMSGNASALEVIRARYGTDRRYNDVSDIVQRHANQGVRSFYVNNDSMRGDPDKADKKTLTVEYVNHGRRYRESAREGAHFRFEGPLISGGEDYYFPGIPPGGRPAEITIENESNRTVRVYSLNQWGGWQWVGSVRPDRTLVAPSVYGQEWRITDAEGRTIEREVVRRSNERVVIGGGLFEGGPLDGIFGGDDREPEDYYYGGGGGYVGTLTIASSVRFPLRVYTVNPGRDWQHVSNLPPGGSASFATEPGRRWMVTDYANRVVREVRAEAGRTLLRVQ